MNSKQPLLSWLLLLAGATLVVVIVSLFVVRLHEPWNWLIPFAFLVVANVVGFLSDFLGIRSALKGETPASQSVTEIKDSQVAETAGDVFQAGRDIVLQTYRTPARGTRFHTPPATRHPLFGRDDELAATLTALRERQSVLLHGMGGIGKTALAGHAAQRLHAGAEFKDGVLWVSEIGPASVAAICDAIARSLGDEEILKLAPPAKLDPTRELLASHDLLLILDDIATPETAQEFLDCCRPAGLALLATSRRRLTDFGVDVPLRPLDRDAAIALFRDRAQMPAATVDGRVGEICDELENHPLALVIAAGRVRAERMPLESLHRRLSDEKARLPTLILGKGQDKNRNVWASLNLSYADLSVEQRLAFTRLATCFGETTGLELLAGVCGMTPTGCEDQVGQLVVRSLVERQGERLSLHQLIRDFGRDILGAELPAVRDQVVEAAREYATRYSPSTPEDHDRLEAELGNLLGAVQIAARSEAWETVLALVETVGMPVSGILGVRGYWAELADVSRLGMVAAAQTGDDSSLAQWTHNAAITLQNQGEYGEARQLYRQSLEIEEKLGNQAGIASSLHNMGAIAQAQGEYSAARRLYQQSLEIKEKLGDQAGIAGSLHNLGAIAQAQGGYAEARQLYQQSLEIFERLGSPDAETARRSLARLEEEES